MMTAVLAPLRLFWSKLIVLDHELLLVERVGVAGVAVLVRRRLEED